MGGILHLAQLHFIFRQRGDRAQNHDQNQEQSNQFLHKDIPPLFDLGIFFPLLHYTGHVEKKQ